MNTLTIYKYKINDMKKILIFITLILSFSATAISKETTFTNEIFERSQLDGKTVVIHSWNKTCSTCAKQVKILDKAKKDFKDVIFLSFEQTKDKEIAKFLRIDYWTTIVVYRDNKEVSRSIGQTNKEKIYSQINSL
jgi:thiol-disulfide isomerase/thioredoxin